MTTTLAPLTSAPRYNPNELKARYSQRPGQVFWRIFTVVSAFGQLLFGVWWDGMIGKAIKNRPKRAAQLREILTRLGPTYIKIGQALSTRPDLVAPLFLVEFTKLQDQLPPFDNAIAFRLIQEELGAPPSEIYQELTADPIAAASLGQVYKGKLFSGETVAVKVQRPDLVERISIDMYVVRILAEWLSKNVKRVKSDLVGIVDEFASKLFEEMDYTQEGRNAERFRELYTRPQIYIPKIYWAYTARRVLTMEWIDGKKLTQLDEIEAQGLNGRELIEIGVNCSLRQLLEHGFFHADPHPGNLLAMADGRLAYLDYGMMSTVEPKQRYGLINAIVHLVNRDFKELASDYVDLGFLSQDTDLSPIIPALRSVFEEAIGASVGELNFKSITDKLSAVMYDHPFRVPAYYALIIRSLVTLEGIAISIDSDFKVLLVAYPYIANRLLSDPAVELRTSLRDILFLDGEFRWNRFENLLRNASTSEDYDLERALDQAIDFLFSERGAFLREHLVEALLSEAASGESGLERVQELWQLLEEDPRFDPQKYLPLLGKIALKPEAQQLAGDLASRWVQRSVSRWFRQWFAPDYAKDYANSVRNG